MSGKAHAMARPITGKHVLIGLVAFFAVVIGVNLVFTYFALDSWTGLATKDTYRKGLNYNETLADAERQARLGWSSAIDYDAGVLRFVLSEPSGAPLEGAEVWAEVRRPTHEDQDVSVPLAWDAGAGDYAVPLALPAAGQWDVEVTASRDGERFRMIHRIWVKP